MARMDRHMEELRRFMAVDIEDDIEDARRAADEALARGRERERQRHLDQIAQLTERLAELRTPLPKREPLVFPPRKAERGEA
jgi:hypothetical protein